jgi:hypothetical protein
VVYQPLTCPWETCTTLPWQRQQAHHLLGFACEITNCHHSQWHRKQPTVFSVETTQQFLEWRKKFSYEEHNWVEQGKALLYQARNHDEVLVPSAQKQTKPRFGVLSWFDFCNWHTCVCHWNFYFAHCTTAAQVTIAFASDISPGSYKYI